VWCVSYLIQCNAISYSSSDVYIFYIRACMVNCINESSTHCEATLKSCFRMGYAYREVRSVMRVLIGGKEVLVAPVVGVAAAAEAVAATFTSLSFRRIYLCYKVHLCIYNKEFASLYF
jgi:hypothetical protein